MKSKCWSYYINEISCRPYYPIQEGEYIIKLEKNGYFDDGTVVLPFDLTNDMYSYNEDRRIKIYKTNFQIPLYFCYSNYNYIFKNYFFYRGKISFYNKTEIIKTNYQVQVNLSYCFINNSCQNENNYQIDCQVTKLGIDRYGDNFGDYLLICKGNINTNVYNITLFGGHFEIRYKIGESSLQELEVGLLNPNNFIIYPPRDILEVNSFEYIFSNSNNIFKFYGKSLNNKIIRNIGSQNELSNFNIYFRGGFYSSYPSSSCYLYSQGNNNNFIIECFLGDIYYDNEIINYAMMEREFINELNNEYDVILPFEFFFSQKVKKIEKDYNRYCGEYVENANSNVCKNFYVYDDYSICDISSDGDYCQPRQLKCNEKRGASVLTCSFLQQDNSKACIKEGESCIETNQCSKVKFYPNNGICQYLNTSSKNNICLSYGQSCIEMDSNEYQKAREYSNPYNGEKEKETEIETEIETEKEIEIETETDNYNDNVHDHDSKDTLSLSIYIHIILFILTIN